MVRLTLRTRRAVASLLLLRILRRNRRRNLKPTMTLGLTGQKWVDSLLAGPDRQFQFHARMEKHVFLRLSRLLRREGCLKDGRKLNVSGKLLVYLRFAALGSPNRDLQDRFQISGRLASKIVTEVNDAMFLLSRTLIRLPEAGMEADRTNESKYRPFKKALGAVDGTHIPVRVPTSKHDLYRNRKGTLTQNVFAAVDFDPNFVYVLAGWEGKAHDAAVLADAERRGFGVPRGHFYLGDGGYPNRKPLDTPFRLVRYHLKEWSRSDDGPKNRKELYNLRHASLRNVVERVFGVLKKRFPTLSRGIEYSLTFQIRFVYAVCALHNFINGHRTEADTYFRRAKKQFMKDWCRIVRNREIEDAQEQVANQRGSNDELRRKMSDDLWHLYCRVMEGRD